MPFNDFMSKVRQWDNRSAKWITRHFYLLFFEIVLVIIFLAFFVNTMKTIDISVSVSENNIGERLLASQAVNLSIIVMLMLLNSFWMLYIFNSILRLRAILSDMNYNLNKRRDCSKSS
ncbi:MAG: hypothetical protein WC552_04195 [Candidatus Omnitrophota bacterium]